MINVLFVCLGNICRSPLAEGVFKDQVEKAGLSDKFNIDSAGTSGWHIGEPPDARSLEVAEDHDIQLVHEGRKFSYEDFDNFDYILAMDLSNFYDIKKMGEAENHYELFLMREFETEEPMKGLDVPDPYYGGPEGFEDTYQMLDRTCENLLTYIKEKEGL